MEERLQYKRLPFSQYFIDTSDDYNRTGKARYKIKYDQVVFLYKKKWVCADWEMHYESDRNVIQINFEQTDGKVDWFVNFMFIKKYHGTFEDGGDKITLKVHNGWAAMYKAMKHKIRDKLDFLLELHPSAEIEIIGWSLGSGQAMLCAQDIYYNFGIRSYLYTFGSVNPFKTNIFNRKKIKRYLNHCCKAIYNFSDKCDIVTYVPFRLFGFIKPKRVNVGRFGLFGLFKLFNPYKYHTHYDEEKLYKAFDEDGLM